MRNIYKELLETINTYHSKTITFRRKKYVVLMAGENKQLHWKYTCFSRWNSAGAKQIPNIEICTKGLGSNNWQQKILMLIHEFGHYTSWENKEAPKDTPHQKLYNAQRLTKKEARQIIEEERRAWKYGFEFLENNGIDITTEMRAFKKRCLNQYYRTIRLLVKR